LHEPHRIRSIGIPLAFGTGLPSRSIDVGEEAGLVGWIGGAAMGALSRPEEALALVKLRVAAGQIKRQIPPEEHWAFGYSMLQKVSRSFALVIQQLGPELRNAVSTNSHHLPLSLFSFHATRIRLRRHLESDAWRL